MGWKPNHKRMKPKAGAKATSEQRAFHEYVRSKGCCITGGAATIHHVTSDGFKRITRSHWLVVPLRADKHQTVWDNRNSVEAMGHAKFNEANGCDLLEIARGLHKEWLDLSVAERAHWQSIDRRFAGYAGA